MLHFCHILWVILISKNKKAPTFGPHFSAAFPLKRRITYQTESPSQPLFVKNVLEEHTSPHGPLFTSSHNREKVGNRQPKPVDPRVRNPGQMHRALKKRNRLRATLPRSSPQYHCRWDPSLLCSEWEQVFPSRYGNRNKFKKFTTA